jgi:hypothetical protein
MEGGRGTDHVSASHGGGATVGCDTSLRRPRSPSPPPFPPRLRVPRDRSSRHGRSRSRQRQGEPRRCQQRRDQWARAFAVNKHNNCPARFDPFPLIWSLIPHSPVPCSSDLGSI